MAPVTSWETFSNSYRGTVLVREREGERDAGNGIRIRDVGLLLITGVIAKLVSLRRRPSRQNECGCGKQVLLAVPRNLLGSAHRAQAT